MKTIKLSLGKKTLVDDDIFLQYGHLAWNTKPHGRTFYAKRMVDGRTVYLHRMILRVPKNFEIDHIDGNGLNNLRSNLRVVSHRENMKNIHVSKTSRYCGVYWNPAAKKWQAYININRRSKYLGVYPTQEAAYAARIVAENKLIRS